MRKKRFIFLLAMIGITVSIYTLVFGEVGYIQRQMLMQELSHLKESHAKLSRENGSLNEQYQILKKRSLSPKRADGERPAAIILKFESDQEQEAEQSKFFTSLFSGEKNSFHNIQEGRIIFLSCMLFLTLAGYTLLRHIELYPKRQVKDSQR